MTAPLPDIFKGEFSSRSIKVLVASTVSLALSPVGLLSVFTVLMQPMGRDFDWSLGQISWLLTCLGLGSAFMSPIIGKAIDRFGPRPVLLIYSALYGVVAITLSMVGRQAWQLYALFICVGLLNAGLLAQGRMIASWFEQRRGLAYGVFGFGTAALTPLLLHGVRLVVDSLGWRSAFAILGLLVLAVVMPMVLLWFREPGTGSGASEAHVASVPQNVPPGLSPREAWTSRAYWQVVGSLVFSVFVYIGVVTHGVAMLTERGLSRVEATTVLSGISIGTMIAQPLIGYLVDRFNSPRIVAPFAAAAFVGLILLSHLTTPTGLILAAVILGLGAGGESGTTQYWVIRYCGLRNFSLIYGSIQPINLLLATAAGPLLLGTLYDRTGSYALNFIVMESALIAAAALILLLPRYVYFNPGALPADTEAKK